MHEHDLLIPGAECDKPVYQQQTEAEQEKQTSEARGKMAR